MFRMVQPLRFTYVPEILIMRTVVFTPGGDKVKYAQINVEERIHDWNRQLTWELQAVVYHSGTRRSSGHFVTCSRSDANVLNPDLGVKMPARAKWVLRKY